MSMFPALSFDCNLVAAASDIGPPIDCEKISSKTELTVFQQGAVASTTDPLFWHFHRTISIEHSLLVTKSVKTQKAVKSIADQIQP